MLQSYPGGLAISPTGRRDCCVCFPSLVSVRGCRYLGQMKALCLVSFSLVPSVALITFLHELPSHGLLGQDILVVLSSAFGNGQCRATDETLLVAMSLFISGGSVCGHLSQTTAGQEASATS